MRGTGISARGGAASFLPAALAASAVAVSILHWFPFLSLLFAAPLFFVRFRYGNKALLATLPGVVLLDGVVTFTTLSAKGAFSFQTLGLSALGTALLVVPLSAMALNFLRRDEYRIAASALVSAAVWTLLALFTPMGAEIDGFLRSFSTETASFFAESLKDFPDSSFLTARLTAGNLYDIARKTIVWSVFPAPFAAYAAGWRAGAFALSWTKPRKAFPFSLENYYTGFPFFVPLALGMLGVILNRYMPNFWLESIAWNGVIGAGFPFVLQGYGIVRFSVRRSSARGKRPLLWLAPLLLLVFLTNGWLYALCALMILGVVELFVPIRRRFIDTGAVDPTPGRGSDQHKE